MMKLRITQKTVLLGLIFAFLGCSHKAYVLKKGETLRDVAKKYDVSIAEIIKYNKVDLAHGDHLFVSSMDRELFLATRKHYFTPQRDFIWPVIGKLTSKFGKRWGKMHEGIDISVPFSTPIRAVQSGVVIYSGQVSGYGNLVAIAHRGGYTSVYAHNKSNKVSEGRIVQRGDIVAYVGSTGNSTGPHLHFELRKNNDPKDPLTLLQKTIFYSQK